MTAAVWERIVSPQRRTGPGRLGARSLVRAALWASTIGLAGPVAHGVSNQRSAASVVGLSVSVAAAASALGALAGFLFGIPKTASTPEPDSKRTQGRSLPAYGANTNLEQISDWVTKILVGITLVEIGSARAALRSLAEALGPGLGGGSIAEPLAVAIVAYFSTAAFILAYLATRLEFAGALRTADLRAIEREREALERDLRDVADTDPANVELYESEIDRDRVRELSARVDRIEAAGEELTAEEYVKLGHELRRSMQFAAAERAYRRAIDLEPTNPEPMNYLGVIYSKYRGDFRQAAMWYREAMAVDPTYVSAVYNAACNEARRGDLEAALQMLRRAIAVRPERYRELARQDAGVDGPFAALREDPEFKQLVYSFGSSGETGKD